MDVMIYCRTSADASKCEAQLPELRKWAEEHGHRIVEERLDVAPGTGQREALEDIADKAKRGDFDILLVSSLDRLMREAVASQPYIHRLGGLGVTVCGPKEGCLCPQPEHPD